MRYLVLKHEDISKLSGGYITALEEVCTYIQTKRADAGKSDNNYLVLNVDEPYAADVYAIMLKHGHTPCSDCLKNSHSNKYAKHMCSSACTWFPLLMKSLPSLLIPEETK